jgi:phosphatidylinositol alpha-1,6-mannosyltransferase
MKQPEITLITLDYPPRTGGVARYLGNLVRQSAGAMRVVVPVDQATDGPGNVEARNFFWAGWPKWWPIVSFARGLKRGTSVILVSHVFPVGTAVWVARLFGGPEYAVLFHGLDIKLAQGVWKRWLLRRISHKAKALFTNSRATHDELKRLAPRAEACVITPGIEPRHISTRQDARRALGLDPQTPMVLSVARLVPRKGIDLSLHAMARIQNKHGADYVVIGDGPDKARLQSLAEEHRARVRWLSGVSDDEKWLWYAAADVFLLPVREEERDMEGFGIVYLEAALAGLPSIAGKSGGAAEAVRHESTGLLVNPKSIDEVEAAIEKLLFEPALREKLGRQGRERALADFRWDDRWRLFGSRMLNDGGSEADSKI